MRRPEATTLRFMTPLVLGNMMNPLNSTMLATALTTICNAFARNVADGALLVTPLYITAMIGQPVMGWLADLYSPKRINTLGFVLVLAAAVVGMAAPSFGWLVVSRVILGLGTSAAYPSAMAILHRRYAAEGRGVPGNVLGVIAVSSQVCMVLGPVLGGLLSQYMGWKGIFFINIPWVLAGLYSSRFIPEDNGNGSTLFPVPPGETGGVLTLFRQRPGILLVYLRTAATNYVLYQLLYALPQWIQTMRHVKPANTGLMLLPMSLTSAVVAMVISRSANTTRQTLWGLCTIIPGSLALVWLHSSTPLYLLMIVIVWLGLAIGTNIIANQAALNEAAPAGQKGISFGLYRTFGYIGAIVAGAQLHSVFRTGVNDRSLHTLGYFALISCGILMVLFIFSLVKSTSYDDEVHRAVERYQCERAEDH
ncbi:MFS transporter [Chitinophaga vietnamensis]|uniref:MFS transporter n=1 Tax=Chitinophaga vietnamensis TaxID=2593957 RepID=UPI001178C99B|nr:MFS transporter [Chitinophaga vietnamensis]